MEQVSSPVKLGHVSPPPKRRRKKKPIMRKIFVLDMGNIFFVMIWGAILHSIVSVS
jgi:hypothetical protein